MNNFSFFSSLKLSWFGINNNKRQIIGWCISIFSIMFLYMILFPSVKDMAQIKLDAMPKELLQFVGLDDLSDMSNYITYFGMVFNIILIAISIFAASFSAGLISREEKTKTIEFLYSLEVSRSEIYVSKLMTAYFAVLAVLCSGVSASGICGAINGEDIFDAGKFILIVKISGFTVFVFMSVSLMIAGVTTKIGAPMAGSMTVLVCYLLGFLSRLLGEKAQWLSKLSPFELFSPENAIAIQNHTVYEVTVYFFIAVFFILVGGIVFNRRDFNL
ncbi:ABC transporter permease subunit [Lacrimispora sp. 38-1]|uniref:ABC transporter permease subunit n=1 Tax=Lacrimispora sp. 38-1 TaxID=3125778 RepID=UPI003CF0CF6D